MKDWERVGGKKKGGMRDRREESKKECQSVRRGGGRGDVEVGSGDYRLSGVSGIFDLNVLWHFSSPLLRCN